MSEKDNAQEIENEEILDEVNDTDCTCDCDEAECDCTAETKDGEEGKSFFAKKKSNAEIKKLTAELEEKDKAILELKDRYARLGAEYDNYKKRTAKELEGRYSDAKCDVLKSILPVLDNFERALASFSDDDPQKQGVAMILEQFKSILASNGVSEIEALGAEFDPVYHNAVMHIDDPELGTNVVAEVFEKGYKTEDKVLRYSMVKVAN